MKTVRRRDILYASAILVVAWELAALAVHQPILPTPVVVAQAFVVELGRGLIGHFLSSLWRVVASTCLAVLLAAPAGLVLGQSPRHGQPVFAPGLHLIPDPKGRLCANRPVVLWRRRPAEDRHHLLDPFLSDPGVGTRPGGCYPSGAGA